MLPLLLVLQVSAATNLPRVYSGLKRQLNVAVPRFDTTVTVDGVLNEPVWREAAVLSGFSQH